MKYLTQLIITLMCLLAGQLAHANSLERLFAPSAELWEFWSAHDTSSTKIIDHQSWSHFLHNNIKQTEDGINRIDYANISIDDKNQLRDYIVALSMINISEYPRSQQLPYWINLYNALTIEVVLQQYPVDSIRDIDVSPGFFSDGPWGKKLIKIEGQLVSLNDIEHRIIRPIWQDQRVHYALNCASVGCPNLQSTAFTSDNIESLLDNAMRNYINHPRGVSIIDGELTVSSIYNWFQDDFGSNEQDVLNHIRQYANTELQKQLNNIELITDYEYDWSLNDTQAEMSQQDTDEEVESKD